MTAVLVSKFSQSLPQIQIPLTFESITDSQCKHWNHLVQCYYHLEGYEGE